MANLVRFLTENGIEDGLAKLNQDLKIKHSRHKTTPNLILFKYSHIKSPMGHPIVQESRGIILDASANWKIVAFPYQKFFNWKETHAASVNWDNPVRIYDKIDGSLLTLYYYSGAWHVASSGIPDASGKVYSLTEATAATNSTGFEPLPAKSYSELFWNVFHALKYQLPTEPEDIEKCFMFELATPENRVVVPYATPKLYCHGVRDLVDLKEQLPDSYCTKYQWELAPFTVIDGGQAEFESKIVPVANALNGLQYEGYVICDSSFSRLKLKSPSYVNFHLTSSAIHEEQGWKRLIKIIQANEGSEFLVYYPAWTDEYNRMNSRYRILVGALQKAQDSLVGLEGRNYHEGCKKLPQWMQSHMHVSKKFALGSEEYFSSPGREKVLIGLLDPANPMPWIPDDDFYLNP